MIFFDNTPMAFTINVIFRIEEKFGSLSNMINTNDIELTISAGIWLAYEMISEYVKKNNYENDLDDKPIAYMDYIKSLTADDITVMWDRITQTIDQCNSNKKDKKEVEYITDDETNKALYTYLGIKVLNLTRRDLGYMTPKEFAQICEQHEYQIGAKERMQYEKVDVQNKNANGIMLM